MWPKKCSAFVLTCWSENLVEVTKLSNQKTSQSDIISEYLATTSVYKKNIAVSKCSRGKPLQKFYFLNKFWLVVSTSKVLHFTNLSHSRVEHIFIHWIQWLFQTGLCSHRINLYEEFWLQLLFQWRGQHCWRRFMPSPEWFCCICYAIRSAWQISQLLSQVGRPRATGLYAKLAGRIETCAQFRYYSPWC